MQKLSETHNLLWQIRSAHSLERSLDVVHPGCILSHRHFIQSIKNKLKLPRRNHVLECRYHHEQLGNYNSPCPAETYHQNQRFNERILSQLV